MCYGLCCITRLVSCVTRLPSDVLRPVWYNASGELCNASDVCVGCPSGRRRARRDEEPEWFTSGPVSQSDTIELHGFDDVYHPKQTDTPGESPTHTNRI